MRTRIIVIITVISDKFALVKAGFFIRDSVYQEPEWSTSRQRACPGGFTPQKGSLKPGQSTQCDEMG
jgi:hypothetical protein